MAQFLARLGKGRRPRFPVILNAVKNPKRPAGVHATHLDARLHEHGEGKVVPCRRQPTLHPDHSCESRNPEVQKLSAHVCSLGTFRCHVYPVRLSYQTETASVVHRFGFFVASLLRMTATPQHHSREACPALDAGTGVHSKSQRKWNASGFLFAQEWSKEMSGKGDAARYAHSKCTRLDVTIDTACSRPLLVIWER